MKTITACILTGLGLFGPLFPHPLLAAALTTPVERVQLMDHRILIWQDGQILMPTHEVAMPFGIIVQTNGVFTVAGGKQRTLQEGDILGRDGMLTKPDGTIAPVMDHVSMNRGRVLVVKDGDASVLTGVMKLGDGSTVLPDGTIVLPNGAPRKLLDGELRVASGALPTRDTITMQGGKVKVQKDGAMLTVDPGRSIMMNDGSKVISDGRVIKFNGEQSMLKEGQILTIDGVVVRSR
jgi:hypothetical protein